MDYGNGLEVEWTGWELAKIAEIKARRNTQPLRHGAVHCAWSGCHRAACRGEEYCWKHRKILRALGDWRPFDASY